MLNEIDEDFYPPQIYVKLTEPERELHSIRYLCLNEPIISLILFSSLHQRAAVNIISTLLKSEPPFEILGISKSFSSDKFHWMLRCISSRLNIGNELVNDGYFQLYIDLLDEVDLKLKKNIIKILSVDKSQVLIKDFKALVELNTYKRPLYLALSRFFRVLLDEVNINRIYDQYNYQLLSFMHLSNLEISSVSFSEYEDFETITQNVFINPYRNSLEFLNNLQNEFCISNAFPKRTFFFNNSILASLFNTSAATKTHFVDVLKKIAFDHYQNGDYKGAIESFSLIPHLQSWIAVVLFQKKSNNIDFLLEARTLLMQNLNYNIKPMISDEFLTRCFNENNLLIRIKQATGQNADFKKKSIPLIFLQFLNQTGNIFNYSDIYSTGLLSFSDSDRIQDCDFISGYFALCNELQIFTHENENEEYFSNFSQSLALVSSKNREFLLHDIFSLLFLQVNEHFLCNSNLALRILQILSSYVVDDPFLKIFRKSLIKLQFVNILFQDNDLSNSLTSYNSLFDSALYSHEWNIAKQIEQIDANLQSRFIVFKAVADYIAFSKNPLHKENNETSNDYTQQFNAIDNKYRDIAMVEIGLSFQKEQNLLNITKSNITSNSEVNSFLIKICDKRKSKHDPLNIISSIDFSHLVSKLQPTNLNNNEWIPTFDGNSVLKNYNLTSSFFEFIDKFILAILNAKLAKSVYDALMTPPQLLLFDLFNKKKFDEANAIASSFHLNAIEALIVFSYEHKEMKLPFIEECPIVNIASKLFSDEEINDDQLANQSNDSLNKNSKEWKSLLLPKLLKLKQDDSNRFNNLKIKYLSRSQNDKQDKIDLNKIDYENYDKIDNFISFPDETYFQKCIDYFINKGKQNNIDIKTLSDLSFRVNSDYFEEAIMKNISFLNLEDVRKLSNQSNCSDTFESAISVLVKISGVHRPVFPLENSLKFLLSTGTFPLATDLCKYFRFQMNTSKVIRDFVLSLLNKDKFVSAALNVCPAIRHEIIESLPSRFQSKVIVDSNNFYDSIPKHWKIFKDPKSTFIRNLNNEEEAYAIFSKFAFLDIDNELLNVFQPQKASSIFETIHFYSVSIQKLIKFFRNQSRPLHVICNQLINFLSQISVRSKQVNDNISTTINFNVKIVENEATFAKCIHKIYITLSEINQLIHQLRAKAKKPSHFSVKLFDELPKYISYARTLNSFIHCFLNTKYGIEYDFSNFESEEKATSFATLCFDYDMPIVGLDFIKTWKLKISEEYYALKLFKLGKFEEGLEYCDDRRNKNSLHTMSTVSTFVGICTLSQMFDLTSIESIVSKIDEGIISNIGNEIDLHSIFVNTINISEAGLRASNRYMKLKAPLFMRVKMLIINGQFDKAFKLFMNALKRESTPTRIGSIGRAVRITNGISVQERWDMFLESIFVVSLSYSYLKKMKVKIYEFDPQLSFFGSLLERLLRFAIDKNMEYLKYELEMILGRTDSAMLTAVSLYKKYSLRSDLNNALHAAKKDLELRSQNLKIVPNSVPLEVIQGYITIIPFQLQFIDFVTSKNIEGCQNLSLINGKKPAESMVTFLFMHGNFSLALNIIEVCEISINGIADNFSDILSNESQQNTIELIRRLEESSPNEIFLKLINRTLMRLYYILNHMQIVKLIIDQSIKNERNKVLLLVQFGEIEKSLDIAKKFKLYDLLPLIGHEAFLKIPNHIPITESVQNLMTKLSRSNSREFS